MVSLMYILLTWKGNSGLLKAEIEAMVYCHRQDGIPLLYDI